MYLGIDIGTTATKAVLVDSTQQTIATIATGTVAYDLHNDVPGISENDPGIWLDAVRSAIGHLRIVVPKELAGTRRSDFPDKCIVWWCSTPRTNQFDQPYFGMTLKA